MSLGKPSLSTKTPDDEEANALLGEGIHDGILRRYKSPKASDRMVAIVVFDTIRVTNDKGKGDRATLVVRHLELPTGVTLQDTEAALIAAFRERTGGNNLPGSEDSSAQLDLTGLNPDGPAAAE